MLTPQEPTIVFAGLSERSLQVVKEERVEALMASYMVVGKSKRLQADMRAVREDSSWTPRTYLDSGVFTFLRRARLSTQSMHASTKKKGPATWEEFREFARTFIDYTSREAHLWDHIVELDVEELWGIEIADTFRRKLHERLGDRLLPVWHAQRGRDGWRDMIKTFPYICLSPTKVFNRSVQSDKLISDMLAEAHDAGCAVHILGVETVKWFELGADTIDASSWSSGVRYGQFKVGVGKRGVTAVTVNKYPGGQGRAHYSHQTQLADIIAPWGYTLADLTENTAASHVGVKLLLRRQEEARAWRKTKAAS